MADLWTSLPTFSTLPWKVAHSCVFSFINWFALAGKKWADVNHPYVPDASIRTISPTWTNMEIPRCQHIKASDSSTACGRVQTFGSVLFCLQQTLRHPHLAFTWKHSKALTFSITGSSTLLCSSYEDSLNSDVLLLPINGHTLKYGQGIKGQFYWMCVYVYIYL